MSHPVSYTHLDGYKRQIEYGHNTVAVCYEIENGSESATLKVVPLFNYREAGETSERGDLKFDVKTSGKILDVYKRQAPIVHESFIDSCKCPLKEINHKEYSSFGAISHRSGKCGYKNKVDLFPNYDSVEKYLESINGYINDGLIDCILYTSRCV